MFLKVDNENQKIHKSKLSLPVYLTILYIIYCRTAQLFSFMESRNTCVYNEQVIIKFAQNRPMSYENKERARSYNSFRTVMDIGMGILYALVGAVIIVGRANAKIRMPDFIMEIPAIVVYILGAMMIIGGLFRFYRGMKAVSPKKKTTDIPPPFE